MLKVLVPSPMPWNTPMALNSLTKVVRLIARPSQRNQPVGTLPAGPANATTVPAGDTVSSDCPWSRSASRPEPAPSTVSTLASTCAGVSSEPLQTYEVFVTSAASRVPLPLESMPLLTEIPPPEQLAPAASAATATSAFCPAAPAAPAAPVAPCCPGGPSGPWGPCAPLHAASAAAAALHNHFRGICCFILGLPPWGGTADQRRCFHPVPPARFPPRPRAECGR